MSLPIINAHFAAKRGTYADFLDLYDGNPNKGGFDLDMLSFCAEGLGYYDDKLLIAERLIADGADVRFADRRRGRTALHWLFFETAPRPAGYLLSMARLLLGAGSPPNAQDAFGRIPLSYAVTNTKGDTGELEPVYRLLLSAGSDPLLEDGRGMSSLDHARELSWRAGFLGIAEEYGFGKGRGHEGE